MKKINLNDNNHIELEKGEVVLFYNNKENYFLCMIESNCICGYYFTYDIKIIKTKGYENAVGEIKTIFYDTLGKIDKWFWF